MSRIIIQLEGGLVQDVFIKGSDVPTKAVVVDFDTEDLEGNKVTKTRDVNGVQMEAAIHTEAINELPKGCDISRLLKAYMDNYAEVIWQK